MDTEADEGAFRTLFSRYLNELWISEIPPEKKINTEDLVVGLLETKGFDLASNLKAQNIQRHERVATKIVNLLRACQFLFGENFHTFNSEALTPSLAKKVHKLIGENVISDCGIYMTKQVQAAQSPTPYQRP